MPIGTPPAVNVFSLMIATDSPSTAFALRICSNTAHSTFRPRRDAVFQSATALWDAPQDGVLLLDSFTDTCIPVLALPRPPSAAATTHFLEHHTTLDLSSCLRSVDQPHLRLLTINCGGLREKLPQLLRLLSVTDADVILLQEVSVTVHPRDLPAHLATWWSTVPRPTLLFLQSYPASTTS